LLLTEELLNQVSEEEKEESKELISVMELIVEDKLLETNNLSPQIILKENTVEFTVCVINECFKKELRQRFNCK